MKSHKPSSTVQVPEMALESVVAELADGMAWNWMRQGLSERCAADAVLHLMARKGLIEERWHPLGGYVWRTNGHIYGRTDGVDDGLFATSDSSGAKSEAASGSPKSESAASPGAVSVEGEKWEVEAHALHYNILRNGTPVYEGCTSEWYAKKLVEHINASILRVTEQLRRESQSLGEPGA